MRPKTTSAYAYFESRMGAQFNKTVFYGLQYIATEYLEGHVVSQEKIDFAQKLIDHHLGKGVFDRKMWQYILDVHKGFLPVRIRAVAEGTPVDVNNVLLTIENTDPNCAPLTNFLETLISNIWASSTVATLSREIKMMCKHYLDVTSDNPDHLKFQLHDFGQRSVSSPESAGICGSGHLINFYGTDTVLALETALDYYNADLETLAFSVYATEHSIMTALGESGEFSIFEDIIQKIPNGILSVVIDSYDYRRFISDYSLQLKEKILARNGKTVFRPDSGEPVATTLDVLNMLDEIFGHTINSKGYKVLNSQIGVLWGDGIDYSGIRNILFAMKNANWSSDNIVFGIGGYLLQRIYRDQQRFAMKACRMIIDGKEVDVYKSPLDQSKKSKKGELSLIFENGKYHTINTKDLNGRKDHLEVVFENGHFVKKYNFDEIRLNAAI
jgi:nicotinamide phosphoribosyltransferase